MPNSRPAQPVKQAPLSGSPRKIDPSSLSLKRTKPDRDEIPTPDPVSVSAGPVDKVIELAFNPSREKIREVTIIDRLQGRLFPLMDTINSLYRNCIEVAMYRQSKEDYIMMYKKAKPEAMDVMDDFMFRTAQWQKSVAGKNLEKATDIALAETETRGDDGMSDAAGSGRGYDD
jgi:hypothetical protein